MESIHTGSIGRWCLELLWCVAVNWGILPEGIFVASAACTPTRVFHLLTTNNWMCGGSGRCTFAFKYYNTIAIATDRMNTSVLLHIGLRPLSWLKQEQIPSQNVWAGTSHKDKIDLDNAHHSGCWSAHYLLPDVGAADRSKLTSSTSEGNSIRYSSKGLYCILMMCFCFNQGQLVSHSVSFVGNCSMNGWLTPLQRNASPNSTICCKVLLQPRFYLRRFRSSIKRCV